MIIVDTSIWIDFFRNKLEAGNILINLIETRQVLILDIVIAELLQGSKSDREIKIIKGYWENLHKISIEDIIVQSGEFSYRNKLIDKGIGLIDTIIIVSAINTRSKIWTKDKKLLSFIDKSFIFLT